MAGADHGCHRGLEGDFALPARYRVATRHGSVRVVAKVTTDKAVGVVNTQHGWWQPCPELGLPGYDPYSAEGANINLLYTNELADPISGSVPHKGYPCQVSKA